jgi:hypothetical protein
VCAGSAISSPGQAGIAQMLFYTPNSESTKGE